MYPLTFNGLTNMKYLALALFSSLAFIPATSFAGIYDSPDMNLFVKSEHNSTDSITSAGIEVMAKNNYSNFGAAFTTALGSAEVFTKKGDRETFLTLDSGIKFGYFSDFFVYGEVGLDLIELAVYDDRDDHDYSDRYDDDHNNIDGYVGVGMGVDSKPFRIEIYARAREIDSRYWEAQNHGYAGLQVSISF